MMENLFAYYDTVTEQPIEWLWYPYIPYGKLTLLQGDPGEGKSTAMLHIAALLTQGKSMPDGFPIRQAESVIYQCSEDDISDTIKPRLLAAGADCSRTAYIIDREKDLTLNDERIAEVLRKTGARLLILDPFQAFLAQDGDMNSIGRMRATLGKLAALAAEHRCAVMLIGHMNKSIGGKSLYRGLGSIDISAIARSVLMVFRDEDHPDIRYIEQVKTNLAPEGAAISFRMSPETGFQWLTAPPEIPMAHSKRETAAAELLRMLQNREVPSAAVFEHMAEMGISERTVYSIKKQYSIRSVRQNGMWYWKLPE